MINPFNLPAFSSAAASNHIQRVCNPLRDAGLVFEQEVVPFGRQRHSFRQRGIHGQQEKEG